MSNQAENPTLLPYAPPARWIHWIMAALVLAVIPAGFVMMNLPEGPAQDRMFNLHRSIGFLILCFAVVRVAVRILNTAPGRPPGMPLWMWGGAQAVHAALYVLIFVMPILGWLCSSAFGSTVSVFGLFDLPNLVGKDDALSDLLGSWHQRLGYLMTVLVLMHIGAGLWHAIVRRDGVLSRMLPFLAR